MMTPKCPLCGSVGKPLIGCEVTIGEKGPVVTVFSCTNPMCFQKCELPYIEKALYYPTQFVPLSENESALSYPELFRLLRDKNPYTYDSEQIGFTLINGLYQKLS